MLTSSPPRQIGWFGYLFSCSIGLSLVLTWLGPRSSEGLGTLNSLAFWFAHVTLGLIILSLIQLLLGRFVLFARVPPVIQVMIGGLIGAIVFTPVAFGLDLWFQPPVATDEATGNILGDIWGELSHFVVPFCGFWMFINAPSLVQLERRSERSDNKIEKPSDQTAEFWGKIPNALGRELIGLSAELHYLRVYTTVGDTLILFAFGRAVDLLDASNTCQIHRSHWVALDHVDDVSTGNGAMTCTLSNGLNLPVSRSHRKALKLGLQNTT